MEHKRWECFQCNLGKLYRACSLPYDNDTPPTQGCPNGWQPQWILKTYNNPYGSESWRKKTDIVFILVIAAAILLVIAHIIIVLLPSSIQ